MQDEFNAHKTKTDRFVIIDNQLARSAELTLAERGLLVDLLSHKPGYPVTKEQLVKQTQSGKDAVNTAIEGLRRKGYAKQGERRRYPAGTKDSRGKDISGQLGGHEWWFTDDDDQVAQWRAEFAAALAEEASDAGQDQCGKPALVPTCENSEWSADGTSAGFPHWSRPAETGGFPSAAPVRDDRSGQPADLEDQEKKTREKTKGARSARAPRAGAGAREEASTGSKKAKSAARSKSTGKGTEQKLPISTKQSTSSAPSAAVTSTGETDAERRERQLREHEAPHKRHARDMVEAWVSARRAAGEEYPPKTVEALIRNLAETLAGSPMAPDQRIHAALDLWARDGYSPNGLHVFYDRVVREENRKRNPTAYERPSAADERMRREIESKYGADVAAQALSQPSAGDQPAQGEIEAHSDAQASTPSTPSGPAGPPMPSAAAIDRARGGQQQGGEVPYSQDVSVSSTEAAYWRMKLGHRRGVPDAPAYCLTCRGERSITVEDPDTGKETAKKCPDCAGKAQDASARGWARRMAPQVREQVRQHRAAEAAESAASSADDDGEDVVDAELVDIEEHPDFR